MAFMRTAWGCTLYTPLPPSVPPRAAVELLHDHVSVINFSPIVDKYDRLEPPPPPPDAPVSAIPDHVSTYAIHENVPLFGSFTTGVNFIATFTSTRDGLHSSLEAPLGLESEAYYQILRLEDCMRDEQEDEEGRVMDAEGNEIKAKWVLRETIHSSVNFLFKALVHRDMVMTRRRLSARMMDRLVREQMSQGGQMQGGQMQGDQTQAGGHEMAPAPQMARQAEERVY